MNVAPSFQEFEKLTEPYLVSGKMYIKVRNPKTGTERQVRCYSDKEYAKAYGGKCATGDLEAPKVDRSADPYWKPQKEVLGFTKGYITIFKGDTYANLEWFQQSIARYTRWWGWYIISTEEVPADLPEGLTAIQLPWELVGNEDGAIKSETKIKEAVDSLIYDAGTSAYQGAIGDRLELTLTVVRNQALENNFGHSNMHIMEDADGNIYVWATSAKNWAVGTEHHIRGTVKNHNTYQNQKQTILTRCSEVK